jgi:DNA-binding PadR family transcriptional regulator
MSNDLRQNNARNAGSAASEMGVQPPEQANRSIDEVLARIRRLSAGNGEAEPSTTEPIRSTPAVESASPTEKPGSIAASVIEPKTKKSLIEITNDRNEPIHPLEPESLEQASLSVSLVEELIMKFLYTRSEAEGRTIADQIRLSFRLITPILAKLKSQQLIVYSSTTSVNDYVYVLSEAGRDRARRFLQKTTYFGAAPVVLSEYIQAVKLQSVEQQHPTREQLQKAFSDLLISPHMLSKLGPAVNSGRGMFLFGYPGNGKTSIAERVTRSFGEYIWIPRAVLIEGEIMRVYDPLVHEAVEQNSTQGYLDHSQSDRRWIRIKRPTVVAGGELTMEMLEVQRNAETNISEAPLQFKSNCGVFLIDDFGRQKISVQELLNRWIVPLEKRYDYLIVTGGKKTQVPFDQLVIFSTNLEPKDLVDDAFLRRIPYKIEVPNPTEDAFRKLFTIMSKSLKIPYNAGSVDYLIEKHYKPKNRPFRNCHPRDLLLQIRSYCYFNEFPLEMTNEYMDFAVDNYFSMM